VRESLKKIHGIIESEAGPETRQAPTELSKPKPGLETPSQTDLTKEETLREIEKPDALNSDQEEVLSKKYPSGDPYRESL
jgi:hypothetical protein